MLPQSSSLDNYAVVKKDMGTVIEVHQINKNTYRAQLKVKLTKNLRF